MDNGKLLLVPASEAARLLSICSKTLWTRTQEGVIPHVKLGGRVLYSPAQLEKWIEQRTAGTVPAETVSV